MRSSLSSKSDLSNQMPSWISLWLYVPWNNHQWPRGCLLWLQWPWRTSSLIRSASAVWREDCFSGRQELWCLQSKQRLWTEDTWQRQSPPSVALYFQGRTLDAIANQCKVNNSGPTLKAYHSHCKVFLVALPIVMQEAPASKATKSSSKGSSQGVE